MRRRRGGKSGRTHVFEVEIIDTTNKKVFFMLNHLFSVQFRRVFFASFSSQQNSTHRSGGRRIKSKAITLKSTNQHLCWEEKLKIPPELPHDSRLLFFCTRTKTSFSPSLSRFESSIVEAFGEAERCGEGFGGSVTRERLKKTKLKFWRMLKRNWNLFVHVNGGRKALSKEDVEFVDL